MNLREVSTCKLNPTKLLALSLIALGVVALACRLVRGDPGMLAIKRANMLAFPMTTAVSWACAAVLLIAGQMKRRAREIQRREMAALARCARRFYSASL